MDNAILRLQARARHRERARANARAVAGAGVGEDELLDAMNRWHLAILEQRLAGGAIDLHLGFARYGNGAPLCTVNPRGPVVWARESLGAFRSPYFSMQLPEKQRIWCGIVWLEQNRGCPECIHRAYKYADDKRWPQPKRLGELLNLGPERGLELAGPRLTRKGFIRGL